MMMTMRTLFMMSSVCWCRTPLVGSQRYHHRATDAVLKCKAQAGLAACSGRTLIGRRGASMARGCILYTGVLLSIFTDYCDV